MKILMVLSHGFADGGAENSVLLMQRELGQRGHEVKILSANNPDREMFSDYQFEHVPSASPFKLFHHLFYLPAYRALKAAIADFQPDLVHFHTLTACSPSVLFATGKVPSLMTIHGPEEFTLKLLPWFFGPTDFRTRAFELDDLTLAGKFRYWYYRLLQRPIYQLGFRRLRLVLAPSRYMQGATAKDFAGTSLKLLYNGTELPAAQALPAQPSLLFVGRLEQIKGVSYLIRAFAQVAASLPTLRLRIVGNGAQRSELEQLVSDLSLTKRVEFAGWVKPSEVGAQYAAASVLVVPSLCPEAFGLVAVEAMATARPVIGSDLGGLPEIITPGQTGFIVPPANVDALAKAIIELIKDPTKLKQMSLAAKTSVKRFDVAKFIDQLEAVYLDLKA